MRSGFAGLIVSLRQLGFGAGLLFTRASERCALKNRVLVLVALGGVVLGLFEIALSPRPRLFMAASFIVAFARSRRRSWCPSASQLVPDASRGKVVAT